MYLNLRNDDELHANNKKQIDKALKVNKGFLSEELISNFIETTCWENDTVVLTTRCPEELIFLALNSTNEFEQILVITQNDDLACTTVDYLSEKIYDFWGQMRHRDVISDFMVIPFSDGRDVYFRSPKEMENFRGLNPDLIILCPYVFPDSV